MALLTPRSFKTLYAYASQYWHENRVVIMTEQKMGAVAKVIEKSPEQRPIFM